MIRHGLDWSKYIDTYGTGWHYDCCGHQDVEAGSPSGQQWGMLLVPEDFADQAILLFPLVVSKMTEVEAKDFYDNKVTKKVSEEIINNEILQGIKLKQDMGIQLTADQLKAIDPNDDMPGIVKNKKKSFDDLKALKDISIKSVAAI